MHNDLVLILQINNNNFLIKDDEWLICMNLDYFVSTTIKSFGTGALE